MRQRNHSYYVVMIDYGKRGLEAIVDPEITRRGVIEMLASGESKHVVFIHHVDDGMVDDVTHELLEEAERSLDIPGFEGVRLSLEGLAIYRGGVS